MRLSQEAIRRMIKGRSVGGGEGDFSASDLAGYATQSWTDGNYISKTFFNELFVVHKKVTTAVMDGDTEISRTVTTNTVFAPNEIPSVTETTDEETGIVTTVTTEIDSIEAKKGFWTNYFISALGKNSDDGGGGGVSLNEPLASINLSGLPDHPTTSGQTIVWNGSAWVYGTAGDGSGTVTGIKVGNTSYSPVNGIVSLPAYPSTMAWSAVSGKPTTLSGYEITDAKIENGVIMLGGSTITPLTQSDIVDMATEMWVSQQISDMATKTWVSQNYISIAYFNRLFQAYKSAAISEGNKVVPNDVQTTIDNLKIMVGAWTEQYLSALGKNSDGSGDTILNEPLASINAAGLASHPSSSGQTIVWNGSVWTYGTAGGGSITAGTGLTGGTSTGTISISSEYLTKISHGDTAYGWGNHATAGYAVASNIYSKTEADAKFLTIAAFERLFNALDSSGQKVSHPYSSGVTSIKALVGLWTEQYLSALGLSDSGGSGGIDWDALAASTNEQINVSHLTTALAPYALTSQIPTSLKNPYKLTITLNGTATEYDGSVARSLTINTGLDQQALTTYLSSKILTIKNGATTLGTWNPTAAGTIDIASAVSGYLPLAGGTMTGNVLHKSSTLQRGVSPDARTVMFRSWIDKDNKYLGWFEFVSETNGDNAIGLYVLSNVTSSENAYGGLNIRKSLGDTGNYITVIDANTGELSSRTLKSTVATGTAPLTIASTTLVGNLNADLLDGQHASYFATAASLTTANGKITTLEGYFDNGVANSAKRLSGTSSYTAWGRTYWSSGMPQNVSGNIDVNTGEFLRLKDGTDYYRIIGISSDSTLLIGWDMRSQNRNTTLCTGKILNIGYGTNAYDTSYGKYWTVFLDNGHVAINTNDDTEVTRNIFLNIGGNAKTNRLYLHTDPNGDTTNDVYLVYENGGVHVVGGGLYADTYVSALGLSDSGGSAFDETAMWQALGTTITEKQISSTYLTNALAPYALKTDIPTLKTLSWSYGSVTSASGNSYDGSATRSFVIPKATSHLTNDSGFITSSSLDAYLPLTGGTLTGDLRINGTSHQNLVISSSAVTNNVAWTGLQYKHIINGTNVMYGGIKMDEQDGSLFRYNHNYTQYRIWDAGNDGSGSGLDADLLDGHDSAYFATATSLGNYLPLAGGTMTGSLKVATGIGISDASDNGLLVYHPTTWTGITSSQWGVGAVDCQGVIRSSNTDLKHYRGGKVFNIVDNLYQEKAISEAGWYRVADISGYGASLILSISRAYNHGEPAPVTFIISHTYNYDSIVQIGGSACQSVAVTNVRLMRYAVGKIYIEIYYSRSDENTVGVEITPLGHRLYNYITLVDYTKITSTTGLTVADSSPVSIGNVSGVTYTSSGGIQAPNYFGRSKVGFLMSNQTINGDSSYKNWIYMDCYRGDNAGGTTAIGVSRTSGRMFVMQSDYNRASFATMREVIVANANGSVNLSSSAGEVLMMNSTNTYSCEVYRINDSSKWSVGANNSNAFYWYSIPEGGTKMTLTSAGNLGIGTTAPSYKLDVRGAARVSELWIGNVRIIHDTQNGGLRLVSAGLYADTYLSALGVGDVGGGGSGTDLETVWTSMAENNSSHTIHISHIQFALSSYLSSNNYITSSSINDMATKTWVGQQGYVTSTTLSGYATQQWVNNQNFATQSWVIEQGYVTSVAMSMPTGFTVTGSPITSSGTLTVKFGGSVTKNYVLASPSSAAGAPTWRTLVAADIPNLDASKITTGTINSSRLPDLSGTYSSASRVTTLEGYFTSGSANTAVKLKTPRAINGTNFDGSAAITTTKWGTARNISIADADATNTGSAISVDGSSAVTLKLPSTIKASLSGNATTATTASKLSTVSKTAWGQTYWTSGGVPTSISGDMSNVGNISFSASGKNIGGLLYFDTVNPQLKVDTSSTETFTHGSSTIIPKLFVMGEMGASGGLWAGFNELYYDTPYIDFHFNYSTSDYTSRIIETSAGTLSFASASFTPMYYFGCDAVNSVAGLHVGVADSSYIQIGSVRLVYDSANNALKVQSPNGGTANLYATGGVSALGIGQESGSGSDATFDTLTVESGLWVYDEIHCTSDIYGDNLYINNDAEVSTLYYEYLRQSSDMRLKDVVRMVDMDVETIGRAPLFEFRWKSRPNVLNIGTSAQYWRAVMPQVVGEDRNNYLSMDYATTALAGVISVARKVMTHEDRIAALEAENERLRNEIETLKAA